MASQVAKLSCVMCASYSSTSICMHILTQTYMRRYMTHICEDCGMIAIANLEDNKYMCPNGASCKNSNIYMIEIPYAAKLLFQVTFGCAHSSMWGCFFVVQVRQRQGTLKNVVCTCFISGHIHLFLLPKEG